MTGLTFIERSRREYLAFLANELGGRAFSGTLGIFGTGCAAELIFDQVRPGHAGDIVFVETTPLSESFLGRPILRPEELGAAGIGTVILSSLANQASQANRLAQSGFAGEIISLPEKRALSPCLVEDPCDYPFLEGLAGRHAGRPAFVIGNGPSLKITDPKRIPDNVLKFGCNGIFRITDAPLDYYFCLDAFAVDAWAKEIDSLAAPLFMPAVLARMVRREKSPLARQDGHYFPSVYRTADDELDLAAWKYNGFETSHTVVSVMIQFAVLMGCDPIHVIGTDLNYSAGNSYATPNYHPESAPKYTQDSIDYFSQEMLSGLRRVALLCRRECVRIVNCSPTSMLNTLEEIDYLPYDEALAAL